ncbi:MAG: hypothetical protein FJ291_20695 [Planctomycetes bacterium]|nr:hypothetical protein [Planctomycetota bacterium]
MATSKNAMPEVMAGSGAGRGAEYRWPYHTDTRFRPLHFASGAEWGSYAEWLRRHIRVSLALAPEPPRKPLRARIFGRREANGYACEKVAFESLPGFFVTGNLYRPLARGAKRHPAVLVAQGHSMSGRLDHHPDANWPLLCINLALMGATVFSYDMVGYNDSCQLPHNHNNCPEGTESMDWPRGGPAAADMLWGLSIMALQTWNSILAFDFLAELPEVDPRRIGITGASGGGTLSFMLGAVDERLAASAPVCMVSCHMQGGCMCENAPLLRLAASNAEITALFAPRPLFIGSCTGDWTCETPTVEGPAIQRIYGFYGAAGRVHGRHVDAGHSYNQQLREGAYGFFRRRLFGGRSDASIPERSVRRPSLRDCMVWWGREAPEPFSIQALRAIWRERSGAALAPCLRDRKTALRQLAPLLSHALGIEPKAAEREDAGPRMVRTRVEDGMLVVEPTGAPLSVPDSPEFFATYNLCPAARAVRQIMDAASAAHCRRLAGLGEAGLWSLLAAAADDRIVSVRADAAGFDPASDRAWERRLPVPMLRGIGGLAGAWALLAQRGVEVRLRRAPEALAADAARYGVVTG